MPQQIRVSAAHVHGLWPTLLARAAVVGCLAVAAATALAEPQINSVNLRGIRAGGTTTLVINGQRLSADTKLVLGIPIDAQTVKPGATDKRIEVELTMAESVPPGLYLLRALNADGVSNGVPIGVDALQQTPLTDRVDSLPAALTGSVAGDQSARTTIAGKKGDKLVIEVEARGLLSELNPVVHLYNARGIPIAWAQGTRRLGGDARLTATLPADGDYAIEVHDALYQGRTPGHFRLKIGEFHYADLVYPAAIQQGTTASVQLLGSLPDGVRTDVEAPSRPQFFPAPVPQASNFTGGRPALLASEWDEVIEKNSSDGDLQPVAVPSGVHGRLLAAGEEDRYRIAAAAGQKLHLDVFAHRLGSPLDGVLTVYDASGKNVLAANDDRPGLPDPGLDFTVPAGADQIVVGIKDLLGRGGDDFTYRLTVAPQDRPDFVLSLSNDRLNVPRAGKALVRIDVQRRGYNGPIDLDLDGLPSGITVENQQIPAGGNIGLVLLSGTGDAVDYGIVRVIGRAVSDEASSGHLVRTAMLPASTLSERQPWLREEIAVALTSPASLQLAWAPAASSLPLGAKLTASVKATRAEGAAGAVRLALVTTQQPPKKTIKENNQDKQVDDVERTLRLEGAPVIAADQSETTAEVIVPADLPETTYGLVLRGELLASDGKQVLATAYAPVLSAQPTRPVTLELTSVAAIDARAGLGETGKFSGKVVRQPGFQHPLRVTLDGLPAGVPPPFEDLAAEQSDFELAVRLPHGIKAEPLKDVQLVAVSLASPGDLETAVRTNAVPVTLNVIAGEKPPLEPPLRIFEDEEEFATSLNQGSGQIRLEGGEKYSGNASVRVTPDQRFNPALSSLGVKIRKEPGPGEYRYLRFAWKKQGGQQLCLQLNHDGQWGPMPGGTGAKFRYHAGPGECYGASVRVAPQPPNRMTVVTRDLYADFGEFTLTGLALSAVDGQFALFDHIYLGRTVDDLDSVRPE